MNDNKTGATVMPDNAITANGKAAAAAANNYGRGSGPRFVKFSNDPNTNSECSNLLN